MSKDLSPEDFAAFYKEVHGRRPFDWQDELARTVCKKGWPRYLDMPTASGKTSVIDIAVFHLAAEAKKEGRTAPLRIAFVVDRRLVVDGALEHAQHLAEGIAARKGRATGLVADALGEFSPGRPLETARLRGGMPMETDWARTPSQPTVIVSTVDQVGSRLLFRGYGVSDSMRPVHAGLLGNDTLFILDEAHTSRPFLDTLVRVSEMRKEWREDRPIRCVFMSATLGGDAAAGVFPPPDRAERLLRGDAALSGRLEAHKNARLVETAAGNSAAAIVDAALRLAHPKKAGSLPPPRNIGVVVNRVALARQVHGELEKRAGGDKGGGEGGAEVVLLTGRARPIERDRVIGPKLDRIRPSACEEGEGEGEGEEARGKDPTTFYVATQCVEVGVDVDFDALVTQAAPLDSLRQRFGRLDRTGLRSESDAVIVAARDEIKERNDPIYGDRIPKAWSYLNAAARKKVVDFGVFHFPMRAGWEDATAPRARSATLMPAYVHMWSQTRPRPDPDPDPAVFLHGMGAKSADVQVVWRADLTDEALRERRGPSLDLALAGLAACRPSQLEAIALPAWTVARWLGRRRPGRPLSDLEGSEGREDGDADGDAADPPEPCALRWRGAGNGETAPVAAGEIRPGDTIVVPSERGGCDEYGWNEGSRASVEDIGMEANLIHRHLLTFRLGGPYLSQVCPGARDGIERLAVELADEGAGGMLEALASVDGIPDEWSRALAVLKESGGARPYAGAEARRADAGGGRVRIAAIRIRLEKYLARRMAAELYGERHAARAIAGGADGAGDPSTDDGDHAEGARRAGSEPPLLSDHCNGVAGFTAGFCERIGMDEKTRADLVLAAKLHDAGKAERRVQAFLRGLDPDDLPDDEEAIAKSAAGADSREEYLRRMRLAHLPVGYRHECWSVRLAESHPGFKEAHDCDLVRYAIGTHHGHGRPVFPAVGDSHAGEALAWSLEGERMLAKSDHGLGRVGSGWVDMCERLYKKYGPWRLAHMEAIVRLADHRQSGKEAGDGGDD